MGFGFVLERFFVGMAAIVTRDNMSTELFLRERIPGEPSLKRC